MKQIGAGAAGTIADNAVEDLRRLELQIERDLLSILLSLDTIEGENTLLKQQARTKAAVLLQIKDRLRQDKDTVVSVAGQRAAEAVFAVLGSGDISANVQRELDMIASGQIQQIAALFSKAVDKVNEAITLGILSGSSLGDVVIDVQAKMKITYAQAQTLVDTAIMAVGRHAVIADAREAQEETGVQFVYAYVGPRDEKNREFCRQWVGKVCTDPSQLDNGQKLPADDFAGGYNCRHSWAPTPLNTALRRGLTILQPNGQPLVIEVNNEET